METQEVASRLKQLSLLMDLHGENEFKSRSIANAAFRLGKSRVPTEGLSLEELGKIDGIGKGIASKIFELQTTGHLSELEEIMKKTPVGVAEMLTIKGLGPKKIKTIWEGLNIESIGELLYACNENRLVSLEGFGAKTQEQVKKALEFSLVSDGKYLYANAEYYAHKLQKHFESLSEIKQISLTGEMRRKCDVIESIEFLIGSEGPVNLKPLPPIIPDEIKNDSGNRIEFLTEGKIPVIIYLCNPVNFYVRLFETTGNTEHLSKCGYTGSGAFSSEEEIYSSLDLPVIIPELREGLDEIYIVKNISGQSFIELKDIKGTVHNHSTYSDGTNTLKEMAERCRSIGYEYFGIADHSQTAVYANGLSPERVMRQHEEIDALNEKMAPFRIFKGIESDILNDGSLDYEDEILETFDYIVASVHSNLKMPEEKATTRLLTAIENPFTTILGHPTGRLLLAREGYPIDHKRIIDACASNNVVIELNANPHRLDIDWRWIQYALKKNVMISINPDAHSVHGLNDMYFGVLSARKGGLTKNRCFNALSLQEIEEKLYAKKKDTF